MYLKKAKRYFDVQESRDTNDKRDRSKEHGSSSGVVCMGMMRSGASGNSSPSSAALTPAEVLTIANSDTADIEGNEDDEEEFRPEDLPDGACFRPRSVLVNSDTDQTAIRPAEYIGSFSVTGEDQDARTCYVKKHLEDMRDVVKSMKVLLVISLSGVKVCSSKGESVYMAHALKRISFATCDPEYRQFSFLAREPKGQINVQFCHAFITRNSPEAEELNTIIGNAFKMAYAQQRERQPTFNELIERQIIEQKAKFAEDQEQAQRDFQQKLNEIATPTPFCEKAIQRMEMRRQLSEETAQEREKELAQQQQTTSSTIRSWLLGRPNDRIKYRSPVTEILSMTSAGRNASPPPLIKPLSPAHISHLRQRNLDFAFQDHRNSAPPGVSSSHPLSVNAIKECFENHNSNCKNKGSPVTALKDEIDKHFNGLTLEGLPVEAGLSENYLYPVSHSKQSEKEKQAEKEKQSEKEKQTEKEKEKEKQIEKEREKQMEKEKEKQAEKEKEKQAEREKQAEKEREKEKQAEKDKEKDKSKHTSMQNRPLPALPSETNGHSNSSAQPSSLQSWSSSDDDNQSPSSSHVSLRQNAQAYNPRRREGSPKGKGQRPLSGMGFDSKKTANGFSRALSCDASYYGHRSSMHCHQTSPLVKQQSFPETESVSLEQQILVEDARPRDHPHLYSSGSAGNILDQVSQACEQMSPLHQQPRRNSQHLPISPTSVPRYQNDSPFNYHGYYDNSLPSSPSRLETLMGLDRSHIEDETLRHASWYQAGIPREIALEILQQEEIGSFIVRDSTTHPGCYALSVKVPKYENLSGISHYLILKTHRGVKLKGLDKEWPNLASLVTHHTVMREMLPCTLKLPRTSRNPSFKDSDKDDKDEDPDYQRLSDFTTMMADLKV